MSLCENEWTLTKLTESDRKRQSCGRLVVLSDLLTSASRDDDMHSSLLKHGYLPPHPAVAFLKG